MAYDDEEMPVTDGYRSRARLCASLLAVPSIALALSSVILLPWLSETKNRLDNPYWDAQLTFATDALVIALCGLPFVIIRVAELIPRLFKLTWIVVIAGYLSLVSYMFQSHFPLIGKLIWLSLGVGCMALAGLGLRYDSLAKNQSSEQSRVP